MKCIFNPLTEPYFNLAVEEYLLDNVEDDIFMLWRNEPSIIVGKFQNSLAEINVDYVKENGIKVVRRQTGGGAVFHDLGNLNFTFVESNSNGNFRTFTEPILEVLHQMGVDARFEGRNDLTINGMKISGNAQCVHHRRMLHHGTLLFSSEMTDLSKALNVNPLKFQDKAVKSVRKRVTNISEYLEDKSLSVLDFADRIMRYIQASRQDAETYAFTEEELQYIRRLTDEKYATWDWNFGSSPKYTFHKSAKTSGGIVELYLSIDKSLIRQAKIYGDFFAKKDISELEDKLIDLPHNEQALNTLLSQIDVSEYVSGITGDEFKSLFF